MSELEVFYFPRRVARVKTKTRTKNFKNNVILGIGANVGSHEQILNRFQNLIFKLAKHPRINIQKISHILKNPPFGYAHQPHFYNAVLEINTALNLSQIFSLIFYLERHFGRPRKRPFANSPRCLDIDIIFFNNLAVDLGFVKVPHAAWEGRLSVLWPLHTL